ncbi:hypothetical protein A0H81_12121 [Grifola frondosa]|uniref:Uncharacterized protein n=1 Tax=Grifola frondosa TaxID=5627 RepID=A0A1C7LTG8_GRIFR|nr:hypothetical protein A0H81_12121 [Grifola frondosa]
MLPTTKSCEVIMPAGQGGCCREPFRRRRFCTKHQQEYVQWTKKYKDASRIVLKMERTALLSFSEARGDCALPDVEAQITRMQAYFQAIRAEIEGREQHHGRFFRKIDHGHDQYLKVLRSKELTCTVLLSILFDKRHQINLAAARARDMLVVRQISRSALLPASRSKSHDFDAVPNAVVWVPII